METTHAIAEPKQARAIITRRKLLDAAVQSLCEVGYSGTTTTQVARRAGVSQGALYKHFGSKQQLMGETTAHLFNGLVTKFREAFGAGAGAEDRVARALSQLWKVFVTPELYAVLELYMVARTDETLKGVLIPVMVQHRENILVEARRLFPEAAAQNPRFESAIDGVMAGMQGAALNAAVMTGVSGGMEVMDFLVELCRRELERFGGID